MKPVTQKKSCAEILATLRSMGNPRNVEGMARFGISSTNTLGVSVPALRKLARTIGRDHALAQELWRSGIHEARHVASLIDEPAKVTERQIERWAKDFDSWDIVDGCCLYLLGETRYAHRKAVEWSRRREEFVKRAAFSLMAVLAVHDKTAPDAKFRRFLPIIQREATDERNFVKKAVNWALRQIGKRNLELNRAAIRTAQSIRQIDSRSARWIAADALRELTGATVQQRLKARTARPAATSASC
jgi:3-methyladenine DNA glycosylase AlkD